jgi:hypothetical protein
LSLFADIPLTFAVPAFDYSSSSASSLPSSPSLTDYLPDILEVALFYHPAML